MADINFRVLKDEDNYSVPQFLGTDGIPKVLVGGRAPYSQIINETGQVLFSQNAPGNVRISNDNLPVKISGTKVSQQLTEEDAVNDELTFNRSIDTVEFYNTDLSNDAIFTANGIPIKVPKGQAFKASIGGTPSRTIQIQHSTSYIVTTYE